MLFDLIVITLLGVSMYLGFRLGTSAEIYRLVKIFIGLSIASTYSGEFGVVLTKMGILKANDWAVLSLTGFLCLFMIYWGILYIVEKIFLAKDLHKSKFNRYLGMLLGTFQALLVITFVSFMSTQLSFVGKNYKANLIKNSFTYIYMDRFCRQMVTANVVDSIINDDGSSTKEVLMKNLGDAAIIKEIIK